MKQQSKQQPKVIELSATVCGHKGRYYVLRPDRIRRDKSMKSRREFTIGHVSEDNTPATRSARTMYKLFNNFAGDAYHQFGLSSLIELV